jgi:hypothetical protein
MNAFPWFTRRTPIDPDFAARRDHLPAPQALDERPLREQRFVVLDLETSGLNMSRDRSASTMVPSTSAASSNAPCSATPASSAPAC